MRQQKITWLDSITDSMDMNLSKIQEIVEDTGAWHATIHEVAKSRHNLVTEQQKQHGLSLWLNGKESACQRRRN